MTKEPRAIASTDRRFEVRIIDDRGLTAQVHIQCSPSGAPHPVRHRRNLVIETHAQVEKNHVKRAARRPQRWSAAEG